VRHPRCVSNKSKYNVYTICRQTQLSTIWYANLLNVIDKFSFIQPDDGQTLWPKHVVEIYLY